MITYLVIAVIVIAAVILLSKKKNKKKETNPSTEIFSIKLVRPDDVNVKLTCDGVTVKNQGLENIKKGSVVTIEVDKDASIYIN